MALGRHVDTEKLIAQSLDHPAHKHMGKRSVHSMISFFTTSCQLTDRADLHDIPYASRYDVQMDLPRYKMPSSGVDAKVVYQLLHDELELGEFVGEWK
jgi:glutamate decarboxylase